MEERKSGNTVLLTVIGIATLLVAIVGATFAFFTANITNPVGSSIVIETATLEIKFTDGDKFDFMSAHPGNIDGLGHEAVSKTFTIENTTNYDANYNLVWNMINHDVRQVNDEFQYKLDCSVTAGTGTAPTGFDFKYPESTGVDLTAIDGTDSYTANDLSIQNKITIKANSTHTCVMTFRFKELNSAQKYNQGRHFYGQLKITPVATNE